MKRLTEVMKQIVAMVPKAVTTETLTTSGFVDVSGVSEVAFSVITGALAKDKSLTVQLVASDVEAGTGAVKVAEQVFVAADALPAGLAVVSYRPSSLHGRYVGVKFKHDAGADVICGVTASLRQAELPAVNDWVLVV